MDFDQTCIDTLLVEGKEFIRFWTVGYDLIFKVKVTLWVASAFISVFYLLHQLVDFDQTCIDTLFVGGKKFIKFLWRPYFQGHSDTLGGVGVGFHFRALSSEPIDRF